MFKNILVGDVNITNEIPRRITIFGQDWSSRSGKANEIEDIFDVEEMWEEYGDKHQRPIEQICNHRSYMTDNSIRNCNNHHCM